MMSHFLFEKKAIKDIKQSGRVGYILSHLSVFSSIIGVDTRLNSFTYVGFTQLNRTFNKPAFVPYWIKLVC